jgi:hypothetical protein
MRTWTPDVRAAPPARAGDNDLEIVSLLDHRPDPVDGLLSHGRADTSRAGVAGADLDIDATTTDRYTWRDGFDPALADAPTDHADRHALPGVELAHGHR